MQGRFLLSVAAGICLAGCASQDGRSAAVRPGSVRSTDSPAVIDQWPYWPVRMRIHPLTRVVTNAMTGLPVIEMRIEMIDRDGHTTKAWGMLNIDLSDGARAGGASANWRLELADLVVNRERFDDVTRTYLIRLEIEPDQALPTQPELRVSLVSADGRSLESPVLRLRTE